MTGPRIALYGHDSLGLGHLRRNLALARSLSELGSGPDLLIVTGTSDAGAFELPPRTDLLQVPSVGKDACGRYRSGRLSVGLSDVVSIRRAVLSAGLDAFAPDLLIVDKVALGLGDELAPALHRLRTRGATRVVLGLRDVLDEPVTTRREWAAAGTDTAVMSLFDEIWVYGDPVVHDVVADCGVDRRRTKVRYTGYLATGRIGSPVRPPCVSDREDYVLCMVGGGSDGARLAGAFVDAAMPPGHLGVVATGSQMPEDERRDVERRVAARPELVLAPMTGDLPRWIPGAGAVVTMGGYNSVSEILATSTPALVVPRRVPRLEQAIRAGALAARGLIDTQDPRAAGAGSIGRWLHDAVSRGRVDRSGVDLDGLDRVRTLSAALLTAPQTGGPARAAVSPRASRPPTGGSGSPPSIDVPRLGPGAPWNEEASRVAV